MNISSLIKKCLKQDRKAQQKLFDLYKGQIMGICLRYAQDKADAEDIFQEAFIKIFTQLPKLKSPEALGGWSKSIAVRTAIDHYHKTLKHQHLELTEISEPAERIDKLILEDLDREVLLKGLNELPDLQRLVFNLFVIEGYKHKEIGLMIGINEASSRVYLANARKKLQANIKNLYNWPRVSNESE